MKLYRLFVFYSAQYIKSYDQIFAVKEFIPVVAAHNLIHNAGSQRDFAEGQNWSFSCFIVTEAVMRAHMSF